MSNIPHNELNSSSNDSSVVAYIVVSWNNLDILPECIESINKQSYKNKKIILIDNNSRDNTVESIRENYKNVQVLAQEDNLGFARANNLGIKEALKDSAVESIVLLNSDARLSRNWTEVITQEVSKRAHVATAQGTILDYYDHDIIDSTHVYISRYGQATQGSYRKDAHKNPFTSTTRVFGCNAAAVLISREFIEAQPFVNLFDETMFMYLEDVDVAARATVMGWENCIVPSAVAYHMGSASSSKKPGYSLRMTYRNNLGLLVKNLPLKLLAPILIKMPKSDLSAAKHLVDIKQASGIRQIVYGRLQSFLYLPRYVYMRHKLRPYRSVKNQELKSLMHKGY